MKLLIFLPVLMFLFSSIAYSQNANQNTLSSHKDNQLHNLDIYLLIGQSNMAGRAEIEQQDKDTLENVFLFTGISGKEWVKATNPLNKYSTIRKSLSLQKLGPGYTFAREMSHNLNGKQIGLVVNAKGGTSILEWMPGTTLYNDAVKRAKMAMENGTLKGIIWHQGESDVSNTETYITKINDLIKSFRSDLEIPDLPFVAGQLADCNTERHAFNQMILQLPSIVSNTGVVKTENTTTMEGTHFNSLSQRLIGERYAKEMSKLVKAN